MKNVFDFEEAGSVPLADHTFVSERLNKLKESVDFQPSTMKAMVGEEDEVSGDSEASVRFRLNATGNIFTSTTSKDGEVSEEAKELFKSVTVLFSAMTKAMQDANKDLFDYDSWVNLIGKTGYFVEVQKFRQTLEIKSCELSVDTQVVQQMLPGVTSGNSMEIAKSVLSAINGKFGASSEGSTSKLAHLMFINEEVMGAASVTVRLFYATKESHEAITESPCHKTVSRSFSQNQEANTFLFVDPDTIAKYADRYDPDRVPESYSRLIEHLADLLADEEGEGKKEDVEGKKEGDEVKDEEVEK
ncbi:hypothetical protein ABE957_17385 [Halomonas sp. CS7]|uniref:Zygote formation protein zyg1 n=1 Tax=Halomonas pelophila TaxID=3151122 RepID=A0ABV1N9N3_9GAMM